MKELTNFLLQFANLNQRQTDFTNHLGTGTVEEAGKRIVKYALLDRNGPTGKFFSEEINTETGEIPW
ncbi:hypothetical protein [Olivibacter sp. XZL3]|uniref:hypothetical protein n=1 Tax=Olivibacter sp. XZL3 TaxID=1735116 RepID=UPI001F0D243A|nr:hypothetical protein [Olivibacter sp. XZL3]